jgi:hypothetical protein
MRRVHKITTQKFTINSFKNWFLSLSHKNNTTNMCNKNWFSISPGHERRITGRPPASTRRPRAPPASAPTSMPPPRACRAFAPPLDPPPRHARPRPQLARPP